MNLACIIEERRADRPTWAPRDGSFPSVADADRAIARSASRRTRRWHYRVRGPFGIEHYAFSEAGAVRFLPSGETPA